MVLVVRDYYIRRLLKRGRFYVKKLRFFYIDYGRILILKGFKVYRILSNIILLILIYI